MPAKDPLWPLPNSTGGAHPESSNLTPPAGVTRVLGFEQATAQYGTRPRTLYRTADFQPAAGRPPFVTTIPLTNAFYIQCLSA